MRTPRYRRFALALVLAAGHGAAAPAFADPNPVTLRMKGGGIEITGELQGLDGGRYIVKSVTQGTLALDASRFDCVGEACARAEVLAAQTTAQIDRPRATAPEAVAVNGSSAAAAGLLPGLVRGYAASLGATATQIVGLGAGDDRFRVSDVKKAELTSFTVTRHGTIAGLAALDQGAAQLVLAERPFDPTKATPSAWLAAGQTPRQEHVLAFDASALIVAPDNPLEALPPELIAQIFAGEVADWGLLGQPSRAIKLYTVDTGTDVMDSLVAQILAPRRKAAAAALTLLPTPAHVAAAVAADPDAIGLTNLSGIGAARALGIAGNCGLITRPSAFAIKAGEYPLARSIVLLTSTQPSLSAVRGFVRYALSKDATPILAESPYFSAQMESQSFDDQLGRIATGINALARDFDPKLMREMVTDLTGARRLSLTIRFADGGVALDQGNRQQIEQLARVLREPEYAGKAIRVLGFSTVGAPADVAQRVSLKRAAAVRAALLAAGRGSLAADRVVAKGYGTLAPVACPGQAATDYLNRRVEVWLHD